MKKHILILSLTSLCALPAFAQKNLKAFATPSAPSTDTKPSEGDAEKPLETSLDIELNEGQISLSAMKAKLGKGSVDDNARDLVNAQINLAKGYYANASDPLQTTFVLGNALGKFYSASANARSADQVSQLANQAMVRLSALTVAQNQKLIEQNQQIIDLLTQLTTKK